MKQNKQMYLSPETEVLVVRFEGVVCASGNPLSSNGVQQSTIKNGGDNGFDGWDDLDD